MKELLSPLTQLPPVHKDVKLTAQHEPPHPETVPQLPSLDGSHISVFMKLRLSFTSALSDPLPYLGAVSPPAFQPFDRAPPVSTSGALLFQSVFQQDPDYDSRLVFLRKNG